MPSDGQDLDALRAALYRPEVTEEDRRRYESAAARAAAARPATPRREERDALPVPFTDVDEPAPTGGATDAGRPRRPIRRLLIAVAGAAAVAAAAGAAAIVSRPAPPPYPVVASTPIALLGGAGARSAAERDLAALFHQSRPFLGLYLARHRTALSASLRTDSIAVDGRGTGPVTVSLRGILTEGQPTGLMTVLLACDRAGTAYSWVLSGPPDASGKPVRTGASGQECGGRIVTSTFVPKPGHVPTTIRITVPEGVRTVVEVDLSKY